ncbi:MAG: hypothetical protein EA383_01820 [Spirochaetaceae bacterium]|nr:MAG: hypothetical protein EA383_01820 [Spirochaetaceae bacterium]
MTIRALKLHPFAGSVDRDLTFQPGLNVVLGPNEAGKSTVFEALRHVIQTPARLTPKRFTDALGSFMPASGGDVIRVSLVHADGSLCKTWQRSGGTARVVTEQAEFTDTEAVQDVIDAWFPAGKATTDWLLSADQDGSSRLFERLTLAEADSVRDSLSSALRSSLMETAGVSVDAFSRALDEELGRYYANWDIQAAYPKNNRGIHNPYKQSVGLVLAAYYALEETRLALKESRDYEQAAAEAQDRLARMQAGLSAIDVDYARLKPIEADIQERLSFEHELSRLSGEHERLKEVNRTWPLTEERARSLGEELERLARQKIALEEERAAALRQRDRAVLEKKVNRLEELEAGVAQARKDASAVQAPDAETIQSMRRFERSAAQAGARIDAERLTVTLTSQVDGTVIVSGEDIVLRGGEPSVHTVSGRAEIATGDLRIIVESGEGEIEEAVRTRDHATTQLQALYEASAVASVEEAEQKREHAQTASRNLKELLARLTQASEDGDLSTLKEQLDALGPPEDETGSATTAAAPRDPDRIQQEQLDLGARFAETKLQLEQAQTQLSAWEAEFGNHEQVVEALVEVQAGRRNATTKLEGLARLPEDCPDSASFFDRLRYLESERERLTRSCSEAREAMLRLERDAPERSAEELERDLSRHEAIFERVRREAEALQRLQRTTREVIAEVDSRTYDGLQTRFLRLLGIMTQERYSDVDLARELPQSTRVDGNELALSLLSHGTKETFALAWRMAVLEELYPDGGGLLLLDDPLVHLDPARRRGVCEAMRGISGRQQIVMLTCHPSFVDELVEVAGGNNVHCIRLPD